MRELFKAILVLIVILLSQGCSSTNVNLSKPVDQLYRDGEISFQKGQYKDALAQWKRVRESLPEAELAARTEINIADAHFLEKEYIEAAVEYENFCKLHPNHELAGYALYGQALSNFKQIKKFDTDQVPLKNSKILFESYLKRYPNGANSLDAQEKIRECRDKQLQYELYIGKFYWRTHEYSAAVGRLEGALYNFSDLPRSDETLFFLGQAYVDQGETSKGREVYSRLLKEYPKSSFAPEAEKRINKLL